MEGPHTNGLSQEVVVILTVVIKFSQLKDLQNIHFAIKKILNCKILVLQFMSQITKYDFILPPPQIPSLLFLRGKTATT